MKPPWSEAKEPTLIEGGLNIDDRGRLGFANDIDLAGVRRFYLISNHVVGRVRAWHGHRRERKLMWPLSGAMLVGLVRIDDWTSPSKAAAVSRIVLAAEQPKLLIIPPGFANGTMSLTPRATLLVFSDFLFAESLEDDIRFDSRYWNPWEIQER